MPKRKGLASASKETRQRVASLGGKALAKSPNKHRLTKAESARGGRNSRKRNEPR